MPIFWIDLLRAEIADATPACAFATVDDSDSPHVRHVICRKIDEQGGLWFVSDGRSEKNGQLRINSQAETAIWLPKSRTQFRIAGAVEIVSRDSSDERRSEAWVSLSDASRALFTWPPPGQAFQPQLEFSRGLPARSAIPETFELLILNATTVEHLDLNQYPHRRRRWEASTKWTEMELNP